MGGREGEGRRRICASRARSRRRHGCHVWTDTKLLTAGRICAAYVFPLTTRLSYMMLFGLGMRLWRDRAVAMLSRREAAAAGEGVPDQERRGTLGEKGDARSRKKRKEREMSDQ